MYKRILVPTDASEYSRRALISAIDLARELKAEIVLLHVTYTPDAFWGYTASYGVAISQEDLLRNGEIALDITTADLTIDVPLERKLKSGHPVISILDEIEQGNIDLVILGSHGYGRITGSLMGSVSQRVLFETQCPVLIIK